MRLTLSSSIRLHSFAHILSTDTATHQSTARYTRYNRFDIYIFTTVTKTCVRTETTIDSNTYMQCKSRKRGTETPPSMRTPCIGIRHSCDTRCILCVMHTSILMILLKAALAHDLITFCFTNKNVTERRSSLSCYCTNLHSLNEWRKKHTHTQRLNWINESN